MLRFKKKLLAISFLFLASLFILPLINGRQTVEIGSIQTEKKDFTANTRFAFVDMQKALLESEAAKQYEQASQKTFQPKIEKLTKEKQHITLEESNLKKDADVLSANKYQKKLDKLEADKTKFLQEYKDFYEEKELADKQEIEKIEPLLYSAVDSIAKNHNLDCIFEKTAAIFVKPNLDLTQEATKELNRITQKNKNMENK
ncbi:MAG: OmpH family outer membrane protein [Endozoicomonadaceae bacterium]|nr:OmpH family outer membrane protein [Endozoicomonadaceae bacterium]